MPSPRRRRTGSSSTLKAKGITPDTWDREAAGYKVEKV